MDVLQFLLLRLFSTIKFDGEHFFPKSQQFYIILRFLFLVKIFQVSAKHIQKLPFHQKIPHGLSKPIMGASGQQHMVGAFFPQRQACRYNKSDHQVNHFPELSHREIRSTQLVHN